MIAVLARPFEGLLLVAASLIALGLVNRSLRVWLPIAITGLVRDSAHYQAGDSGQHCRKGDRISLLEQREYNSPSHTPNNAPATIFIGVPLSGAIT